MKKPETRVVCISRTVAAGGERIARMVARRLEYRYVDDEIIVKAAERANVDPSVVASAERRRPLLDRILDALATPGFYPPDPSGLLDTATFAAPQILSIPDTYRELIREVVRDTAEQGSVVILAHAASIELAQAEGVLRVLVTASEETRTARLAAAGDMDLKQARAAMKESDAERTNYFREFHGVKDEAPTRYDLVLNTDRLDLVSSVEAIAVIAQS